MAKACVEQRELRCLIATCFVLVGDFDRGREERKEKKERDITAIDVKVGRQKVLLCLIV